MIILRPSYEQFHVGAIFFFFLLLNYICKLYHHREGSLSLLMNRDQLSDGVNVTVQLRRTPLYVSIPHCHEMLVQEKMRKTFTF